jgi:hypothetical protein
MVVVPLSQSTLKYSASPHVTEAESPNWTQFVAAGALVAGGVLLFMGWRRAGMVTAAAGTIVTLIDQQDTVRSWWSVMPGYIDSVKRMLDQVENTVEEIDAKRETLRQILSRPVPVE